ncbi:hypothetical protein PRIPAC_79057 [Pristionchus pacificus]|uniref:G protein-coupled receptor n=1 Tax=Pristionchus pacificus TaxID=54126 RepID=A0A2A6BVL5_PRIPA|nr:hypothetical protein PRIPAC_79057 [Pristionchus pacificus]|eukprot:PDM70052.1 G protein-coupled receptor [Pristionchus pacificus]
MASPLLVAILLGVSLATAAVQYAAALMKTQEECEDELTILQAAERDDCPNDGEDAADVAQNGGNSLRQPLLLTSSQSVGEAGAPVVPLKEMKYKTRLIAKESQLAKLKSMLNAAMDEAIFVQSQGTVFSPSSTLNALRDTIKEIQAEDDMKKFYNHELDYIAFAEKFAGFAQKLRGVRLRTVDSDELLDFNMAEFHPVRARAKPSILQRHNHTADDTLHSLLQAECPTADPRSSTMASTTSPSDPVRTPPSPLKAVRKEEARDAPSTSTATGRTSPRPSAAAVAPLPHSPPKMARVMIHNQATPMMQNGLDGQKFLEAKRAALAKTAAEATPTTSSGAVKTPTTSGPTKSQFNNGRMLVRCEFCTASVDERDIINHVKEKHPEKKAEAQRRRDDAKRLHDLASPAWAAMTAQAEKLKYWCPELACDFAAETTAVRDAHVKRIHRESYMVWMKMGRLQLKPGTRCPYCTKSTVKDVIGLCQHAIKFHPIKMLEKKEIYSCSTCDARFSRVYEVYQHWYQDRECLGPLRVVSEGDVNTCLPMRAFAGDPLQLVLGGRDTTGFIKLPPVVNPTVVNPTVGKPAAVVKPPVVKPPVAKPIVVKKEKQTAKNHCQVLNFFREQTGMSERTLRLHKDLIMALTVHAMIPPIYFIVTLLYAIMFFGIYRRAAMEKAMFLIGTIPSSLAPLCTLYYVEPYRQVVTRRFLGISSIAEPPECLGPLRVLSEGDVNMCLPMRAFAGDPLQLVLGGRDTTGFIKLPPVAKPTVAKPTVVKPIVVKKEKQTAKK